MKKFKFNIFLTLAIIFSIAGFLLLCFGKSHRVMLVLGLISLGVCIFLFGLCASTNLANKINEANSKIDNDADLETLLQNEDFIALQSQISAMTRQRKGIIISFSIIAVMLIVCAFFI